ncbi:DUF2946 family protein [Piscinibacter sakaiensis]|uniref:DUF2946 family protein n=1 Tax=Piscinibacter sakaiensis TaxID=1547922 RepID=UPI003AAA82B5
MDDIVKAALQKWPNVPHCRGWLALDARGDWYLRDDQVQAAGPFPQAKGSRIEHAKLREFIERNYAADDDGAWFFQNGPQRVYVELEAAPFVWRLAAAPDGAVSITSHTGSQARYREALLDENGRLFLVTDLGCGLVHSLDMNLAAEQIEAGRWKTADVVAAQLPRQQGFVVSPLAAAPRG